MGAKNCFAIFDPEATLSIQPMGGLIVAEGS